MMSVVLHDAWEEEGPHEKIRVVLHDAVAGVRRMEEVQMVEEQSPALVALPLLQGCCCYLPWTEDGPDWDCPCCREAGQVALLVGAGAEPRLQPYPGARLRTILDSLGFQC